MTGWERAIDHLAARGGLALRRELLLCGVNERTLLRRVRTGQLVAVNSKVLGLPGKDLDLATLTRAAVLARPAAIPTGLSSAALLGSGPWDGIPLIGEPWLVSPPDRTLRARCVRYPGLSTVMREGLIVASPASTVIDLLRFLRGHEAVQVGRAALQRRVVTLDLLHSARARLGRVHGLHQLDVVIAELVEGTHAESEHRFVTLLRDAGIVGWQANYPVRIAMRQYFIDVAFPRIRLAIEIDGRAHHSDSVAFQRDRRRQNDLVAAGWTVLRFTWDDLIDRPDEVLRRVLFAIERAQ